jgi:hypothetical protein
MAITKLLSGLANRSMAQEAFDVAMGQLMVDLPIWGGEVNATAAAITSMAAGGAFAIPYTFSSTTTDGDPGAGFLRLSSATQNASTVIRLDLTGADLSTWTSVIDTFDDSTSTVKGHILLQKSDDTTKWLLFSVTSLASPSGYKNVTVVPVASSAASPFTNGNSLTLKFQRTGDVGTAGTIVRRTTSIASSATPTPDSTNTDLYNITALATAPTFGAPSGAPADGQGLIIRVKDNGTARLLAFNAIYRASSDLPMPTTTIISKTLYMGFIYNSADTKWDLVSVLNNF